MVSTSPAVLDQTRALTLKISRKDSGREVCIDLQEVGMACLPKWKKLSWWWFWPCHLCTVCAKGIPHALQDQVRNRMYLPGRSMLWITREIYDNVDKYDCESLSHCKVLWGLGSRPKTAASAGHCLKLGSGKPASSTSMSIYLLQKRKGVIFDNFGLHEPGLIIAASPSGTSVRCQMMATCLQILTRKAQLRHSTASIVSRFQLWCHGKWKQRTISTEVPDEFSELVGMVLGW